MPALPRLPFSEGLPIAVADPRSVPSSDLIALSAYAEGRLDSARQNFLLAAGTYGCGTADDGSRTDAWARVERARAEYDAAGLDFSTLLSEIRNRVR